MIHITTHLWGQKFGREYVDRLAEGVRRHLPRPYKFIVITEDAKARGLRHTTWEIPEEDRYLLSVKGCFCRLRLFDPEWQAEHGIKPGDRIVSLDLDLIVTGPLERLFNRQAPFLILQGVNTSNPGKFNGSLWMLSAGYRADIWSEFSLDAARALPHFEFPDDQAFLEAKLPDAGAWTDKDGVFAFQKRNWPKGDALPSNAKVVAFPGWRDPSKFTHLSWVRDHWK